MKVLVTGVGGFIGGTLARGFVEVGKLEVIGLYHNTVPEVIVPGLRIQRCDLRSGVNLTETVDFIVHCAAIQQQECLSVKNFIDANLAMTESVAGYARQVGAKGLILISSISLHGEIKCGIVDEHTSRINPTLYGISKYLCEEVLRDYEVYFPTVALRLCGVVGSGAKNIWLSRVRDFANCGEDIAIFNSHAEFNNILHADDVLRFMMLLFEREFTGFNAFPIGSMAPMSIREVIEETVKGLKSHSRIIDEGVRGDSFLISSDYAIKNFGYMPAQVRESLRKYMVPSERS